MPKPSKKHKAREEENSMRAMELRNTTAPAEAEFWTSDKYNYVTLQSDSDRRPASSWLSRFVFGFSVLLILAGLALIIIAIVAKTKRDFLPLCPNCSMFITSIAVFGVVLFLVGALGVAAALIRKRVLAIPYMILMILMGLGCAALAIGVLVFQNAVSVTELEPLWKNAVQNDQSVICDLQSELRCSGFGPRQCCNQAPANSTPPNALQNSTNSSFCYWKVTHSNGTAGYVDPLGISVLWPPLVCAPQCIETNAYSTPCDDSLQRLIKDHLYPMIGTLFPLAILLLTVGLFAFRMTLL